MIAGFERPTAGEIYLDGRAVGHTPPYRRNVNTVFQPYALSPHKNVRDNVSFGLRMKRVPAGEIGPRVERMLALIELPGIGPRFPHELSGGQQQRVALARALVNQPTVLLLDEPLGALDLKLRKDMQLELKDLQQQVGITFVYVTHDQEEALTMSDRIAVMQEGRILQEGTPREIYEHPTTRFVADFIGLTNFLDGEVVERHNDRVLAKTRAGLAVWCASGGVAAPGSPVTVAVRPEQIEIPQGRPPTTIKCWRGPVVAGTFLGEQTEYRVRLEPGQELVVRRQNLGLNGSNPPVAPGALIYVTWPPDVSLVLPRPAPNQS